MKYLKLHRKDFLVNHVFVARQRQPKYRLNAVAIPDDPDARAAGCEALVQYCARFLNSRLLLVGNVVGELLRSMYMHFVSLERNTCKSCNVGNVLRTAHNSHAVAI